MIPSLTDIQDAYAIVKPHAGLRVAFHFGGDPEVAMLGHPKRQSAPGRYLVWVGNKYATSDKSLSHAATLAIKQIGGTRAD